MRQLLILFLDMDGKLRSIIEVSNSFVVLKAATVEKIFHKDLIFCFQSGHFSDLNGKELCTANHGLTQKGQLFVIQFAITALGQDIIFPHNRVFYLFRQTISIEPNRILQGMIRTATLIFCWFHSSWFTPNPDCRTFPPLQDAGYTKK